MSKDIIPVASRQRLLTLVALFACAGIVLFWRAIELQVVRKDFLQTQGDARYLRVLPVVATRGMISDRHGEPLAISTPVDSVWVHPKDFITVRSQWASLAKLLGLNLGELKQMLDERREREFVYIKRRISPELAQQVMALELPGVAMQREYRRYYPLGEVAAHVVGFTNVDDQGQEGLELAYDNWLRGEAGKQRVIKDRLGKVIQDVELVQEAKPGKDLSLSIDRRLQYLTYRELKRSVMHHHARSGSAIILDALNGEVLAMVSQPAYNPNNVAADYVASFRNRSVTDVFEPGSTIKPFTIAAALESGRFSSQSVIDTAPGYYKVGAYTIRDAHNNGRIDIPTIIQKSSNVGASKIALALKPEQLWKINSSVGFGDTSGSGFPGEVAGILKRPAQWREIDRATLAFGYGLSVTALQLVRAYGAIAADGMLLPVSFLNQNNLITGKRVMQAVTAQRLRKMLERVVSADGTALRAKITGYSVAGKTGTVKKLGKNGYSDDRYSSIFVGMAPATHPRLVMLVYIDEPHSGVYYGGEVAAPVFEKVMSVALRTLNVAPDAIDGSSVKVATLERHP